MTHYQILGGDASRLGAIHDGEGVNFAVFSQNAMQIELCLFTPDDGDNHSTEFQQLMLPERTGPIWHGFVPALPVGSLYGYRAHGNYAPEQGFRFNPNKLLLDPYTRELRGNWVNCDELLGYDEDAQDFHLSFDGRDSAPFVPKSVVSDAAIFQPIEHQPLRQNDHDLIYEVHVKGLTQTHREVPEALRGTYEGLASDAMIAHFKSLGVSAVELLPVHSFIDESFLLERGLTNYWGYNSIGFFTPESRYFGPEGLIGFRKMVAKLRANNIGVILDVVYNHTAEGDQRGPTLCYRGLDNPSYYRLAAGQPGNYVNDTGCGNTLNLSNPNVLRMVMDSLRFWVQCTGVEGFRFDLATTLGREDYGFDVHGSFFDVLRQDPVLSKVRLIAEPWDIGPGGYQLGGFPHEFSEWNDNFRDGVRKYWKGDALGAQSLAAGLLGCADKFDCGGRRATSSVNFVSSHDGFTLADICRYNERHNEANRENNRDGHHANYSDNCGVEGESDDPVIGALRIRRQRNMLAIMFLSQGTPMLLGGDEIGNSQRGNNNAYCQDNEIGWLNWETADVELLEFVVALSAFRRAHKSVRQSRFLHGARRQSDGMRDVEWTDFTGQDLNWDDPELSNFCLILRCSAEAPEYENDNDAVFIVINRDNNPANVILPTTESGRYWQRCIDTANDRQSGLLAGFLANSGDEAAIDGHSVVVFALAPTGDS